MRNNKRPEIGIKMEGFSTQGLYRETCQLYVSFVGINILAWPTLSVFTNHCVQKDTVYIGHNILPSLGHKHFSLMCIYIKCGPLGIITLGRNGQRMMGVYQMMFNST